MDDPVKPKMLPVFGGRFIGMKRRYLRYVEIGEGKIDPDGTPHMYVDRMPLNFTGHITMTLDGKRPEVKPVRPGDAGDTEDDEAQD